MNLLGGRPGVKIPEWPRREKLKLKAKDKLVDFGPVQIKNDTFRVILHPNPKSTLLVRYFGFGVKPGGDDDQRNELLRSLGYIR